MAQPNPTDPNASIPEVPRSSISAAAQVYQNAMQSAPIPPPAPSPAPQISDTTNDVVMAGSVFAHRPNSPAQGTGNATSPRPPRTSTPSRNTNGNDVTSRAASQHPDTGPAIPSEAPPHGAPTRQYLNGKVTGVLLEGMKQLAKEQPKDPLQVLGEYLLQRSRELEGT